MTCFFFKTTHSSRALHFRDSVQIQNFPVFSHVFSPITMSSVCQASQNSGLCMSNAYWQRFQTFNIEVRSHLIQWKAHLSSLKTASSKSWKMSEVSTRFEWLETGSPNSFLAALVSCRVSSDVEPPAPQVKSVKSGPKAFQIQKGENCTRN